jgi:hypothetical protein
MSDTEKLNEAPSSGLLQPRLVRLLLGVRKDTVWHQDSPGVRVDVIRNNLTRLWRSPEFSEVGETHYLPTVFPPNPMPTNKRISLPNADV